MTTSSPLRIGLAGLGTVGLGVINIIEKHSKVIALRAGREIKLVAISARDPEKDRGVDLRPYIWENDPVKLATRDDIDVFIEVMGGHEGAAKNAVIAALSHGKDVVSANKALFAHHGQQLAELAEEKGCIIRFEAAVAGGIPVIKVLSEGLAANKITRIMGVLNGTCNYILTRMQDAALPYETVFEEARYLGYLESDPNLDVGGIDAGHKLSLLASIAFGTKISFDDVQLEGIGNVSIEDITNADEMGYRIKLLGVAQLSGRGLEQRMAPCLVPKDSPLGQLAGGTNMIVLEGDNAGQIVLRGAGAGSGPTASAIMADAIDIARGFKTFTFGRPASSLATPIAARTSLPAQYYLRMTLVDKPGALASVATIMGEAGISIDQMRQINKTHEQDDIALLLIVTHPTAPDNIDESLRRLKQISVVQEPPVAIRIEEV